MRRTSLIGAVAFVMLLLLAGGAWAQHDGRAVTRLRAFDEVPSVSSVAGGNFEADIVGNEIQWELTYFQLSTPVTQAHIHFAQKGVNGGIVIFLCSNLPNPPAGTAACPASGTQDAPARISGTIHASDVVSSQGATNQGISPGELGKVLRAIRAGMAYANVHTERFPGGEIRGQLRFIPEGDSAEP